MSTRCLHYVCGVRVGPIWAVEKGQEDASAENRFCCATEPRDEADESPEGARFPAAGHSCAFSEAEVRGGWQHPPRGHRSTSRNGSLFDKIDRINRMNGRHAERSESAQRRFVCGESRPFRAFTGFGGPNPGLPLRSALGFRISPPWGFSSESRRLLGRNKRDRVRPQLSALFLQPRLDLLRRQQPGPRRRRFVAPGCRYGVSRTFCANAPNPKGARRLLLGGAG
jgi:hypothetical protein